MYLHICPIRVRKLSTHEASENHYLICVVTGKDNTQITVVIVIGVVALVGAVIGAAVYLRSRNRVVSVA